jgi:V8-like Glu-specific endopeptidase
MIMSRRYTKFVVLALTVMLMLMMLAPVAAITNGGPDGNAHPYVGLMVAIDADGNPLWRCSGTLMSSTVFLTAGHCTEAPAARAAIWFEEDVESGIPGNGYPFGGGTSVAGTVHTHPQYNPNAFFLYDLGVVVLDAPYDTGGQYGHLAPQGTLDGLATRRGQQDTSITAVGYGLQKINPVVVVGFRQRLRATLRMIDVKGTAGIPAGTSVTVSANHNTGGTCFGDSGGPQFLNDTNLVVAVTSYGLNGNCAGVGGGYRVDTADDQAWLAGFGITP